MCLGRTLHYLRQSEKVFAEQTFIPSQIQTEFGNQPKSATAKPYQIIGQWLKENTPDDAKVALVEIGTVGWYSDRYIRHLS